MKESTKDKLSILKLIALFCLIGLIIFESSTILKPIALFCIIGLIIFESSTIIVSVVDGDIYFFPMNLLAKNDVESNPKFQEYLTSSNMILKELSWLTARRVGDIWIFYIVVQDKEITDENRADSIANKWSYYSNGDVYYNAATKQITVDIISHQKCVIER